MYDKYEKYEFDCHICTIIQHKFMFTAIWCKISLCNISKFIVSYQSLYTHKLCGQIVLINWNTITFDLLSNSYTLNENNRTSWSICKSTNFEENMKENSFNFKQ